MRRSAVGGRSSAVRLGLSWQPSCSWSPEPEVAFIVCSQGVEGSILQTSGNGEREAARTVIALSFGQREIERGKIFPTTFRVLGAQQGVFAVFPGLFPSSPFESFPCPLRLKLVTQPLDKAIQYRNKYLCFVLLELYDLGNCLEANTENSFWMNT